VSEGAAGGKAAESAGSPGKEKREERGKAAPSDRQEKGRPDGAALFFLLADLAGGGK
jgi:hypothetical protein